MRKEAIAALALADRGKPQRNFN